MTKARVSSCLYTTFVFPSICFRKVKQFPENRTNNQSILIVRNKLGIFIKTNYARDTTKQTKYVRTSNSIASIWSIQLHVLFRNSKNPPPKNLSSCALTRSSVHFSLVIPSHHSWFRFQFPDIAERYDPPASTLSDVSRTSQREFIIHAPYFATFYFHDC